MEMKSPGRSPVMVPSCLVAGVLFFHFVISHADSGQFHVIGPKAPVTVLVGEEVVLPCHLSPLMDAQDMEVKWYRDNPFGLVHQYVHLEDHMEQQMPEYQGRTEFLKDNITTGHVALRIHDIRPSDAGEYSCYFQSSMYFHQANFQVLVTDALIPRFSLWHVIVPVTVGLLVITGIIYVLLLMRARKSKGRLMKQYGELQKLYEETKEKNVKLLRENEKLIKENENGMKKNEEKIKWNEGMQEKKGETVKENEGIQEKKDELKKEKAVRSLVKKLEGTEEKNEKTEKKDNGE
ncbi:myelin-oligodendrocyte glycoprotein-like [Dasypus novemcinctus]|uniref:myelin-oligodendrocyte glycoprotein-like n=1 Tax=Dasypus novemcinctus TaxID=9361 RepID=UPI0039C900F6